MTRIVNHRRELRQELKEDLKAYFLETTVHGFRYVVEGRNLFERIAWVAIIIFGFAYTAYTVSEVLQHWDRYPLETTIDKVGIPVQELPFPAITVCDTKSSQMPRRNRWLFLETLLNSLELSNPKEVMKRMNPGIKIIII